MKRTKQRIKRFFLRFIPAVIKTGILYRIPSLFSFFEIKPTSSMVFITGRCNSRCIMCKQWKDPDEEELSCEDWKKIIFNLKESGISNLHFTGGEPLLHRDLPELITYATHNGFTVGMTTNGLLLKKETLEALIDVGLSSIAISVDAVGNEYDKIRGVPGAFERIKEALFLIAEANKKKKIYAYINFTLMNNTIEEFDNVKMLADELDMQISVSLLDKNSYIFNVEENRKDFWIKGEHDFDRLENFIASLRKKKIKKPGSIMLNFPMIDSIWEYFKDPRQKHIPCVSSQDRLIIDSRGNILGGCMSMGTFGNLKEKPLGELIKKKSYQKAKKNMFYKNCAGCSCGYQFNIMHTPSQVIHDFFERMKYFVFRKGQDA